MGALPEGAEGEGEAFCATGWAEGPRLVTGEGACEGAGTADGAVVGAGAADFVGAAAESAAGACAATALEARRAGVAFTGTDMTVVLTTAASLS